VAAHSQTTVRPDEPSSASQQQEGGARATAKYLQRQSAAARHLARLKKAVCSALARTYGGLLLAIRTYSTIAISS
jgi:hypothetical protein